MYIPTKKALLTCLLLLLLPSINAQAQTCDKTRILATNPTSQFTDHNNGTVTDKKTGLMWKKCSEGQIWSNKNCTGNATKLNWQGALNRAITANSNGGFIKKTDWRVPNVKEITSIVEQQCQDPAINLTVFQNTQNNVYWSSSPYAAFGSNAWGTSFDIGNGSSYDKKSSNAVRLVRGGK